MMKISHDSMESTVLQEFKQGKTNLTAEQLRLWFLLKLDDTLPSNLICLYRMHNQEILDIAVFQQSISEAVRCFPIFRSVFSELMNVPLCKVVSLIRVPVSHTTLTMGEQENRDFIDSIVISEQHQTFDLDKGPLFKIHIFSTENNDDFIVFSVSKLIGDQPTVNAFMSFVFSYYQSMMSQGDGDDVLRNSSSKTLYQLESEWLKTIDLNSRIKFWEAELHDLSTLKLPEDFVRPEIKNHLTESVRLALNTGDLNKLQHISTNTTTSLERMLLTAFSMLLSTYTQQTNFCIGLGVDNRNIFQVDNIQGNAENIIPLKITQDRKQSFLELLTALNNKLEHDLVCLPLKFLIENTQKHRDLGRTPIFQVMFHYEDFCTAVYDNGNIKIHSVPLCAGRTSVDLSLNVSVTREGTECRIDYNTSIFSKQTITQLLQSYVILLESIICEPNKPAYAHHVLDAFSYDELIVKWNETHHEISTCCLHTLVEMQAKKTPAAIAVTFQHETINYLDLDQKSNQLAHYIQSLGLDLETKVAIFLDRSIEMVIALLGVIKAGCAYVPVDPTYPIDRIEYMLKDSSSEFLITDSHFTTRLTMPINRLFMDTDWHMISTFSTVPCSHVLTPDNLAYLIYTSGSTGQPKAVMVTHKNAVNNMLWRQNTWNLTENDVVLHNTSFSFDPSVWSTFWPLSAGASFVITPSTYSNDSRSIVQIMIENKITVIGTVPSLISLLLDEPKIKNCTSLRYILSGGEPLTYQLKQKIMTQTQAQLANLYGPTETTIDATYAMIPMDSTDKLMSIGKPIANQRVYILDQYMQPVPQGVKGEICIGGVGVARGYHGQPGLTAERFIPDLFSTQQGDRLYRTGDIGRIRIDGNLEYLGRMDDQVKLNGYRIELNEIEQIMGSHSNVNEVAILLDNAQSADARLVAYIVTKDGIDFSLKDIQTFFAHKLPNYMIPTRIHHLDKMPKTSNGKIDRQSLTQSIVTVVSETRDIFLPRNATEHVIANYFCEVLLLESIGIYDDFFECGGTSLSLTRLASKLYEKFDISIPLHQFFKVPTVVGICDVIATYQRHGIDEVMAEQHATKLAEDAVLDAEIHPGKLKLREGNHPKAIFLTGSTGYLGAFLLQELIENTHSKIYCLIRSKSIDTALKRVQQTMTMYKVWKDEYINRIIPVCGDLAKPKFGLDEETWTMLAITIDVIYHNGALVNFAYPYSALRAVNVLATQDILRLACTHHLKAVHYISTIDVLLATHTPRPFIEDDTPLRVNTDIPGGYTASKWVSEKMMNTAIERGIPVCIYRPGLIMSHSETGATQTNDYILVAFRGFVPMKIMPNYSRIFDIVPVDYVAKSIVHISMQADVFGKFFHLFNPAPVSLQQFCDWTITYGYEFDIVPFEVGRKRAMDVDIEHPLYPLVPLIRDADPEPQRSLDPNYMHELQPSLECSHALNALKNSDIVCPSMSEKLTHLCLEYLIGIDYLPSPSTLNHGIK